MVANPYSHSTNESHRDASSSKGILLSVVKRLPFCTWFLLALSLWCVVSVWNPEYDGGGIGALLVLTQGLWGFPIYLPHEMLISVNNGNEFPMQGLIAMVIGGFGCIVCDLLFNLVVTLRHNKQPYDKT